MNKTSIAIITLVVVLGAAAFQFGRVDAGERVAAAAQAAAEQAAPAPAEDSGMLRGKVLETMNTAGYTYALVDTGSAQLWLAGPQTAMAVGDVVEAPPGFPMQNYHSKSLERDFDVVYFVSAIHNTAAPAPAAAAADAGAMPPGHPPTGDAPPPAPISIDVAALEEGHDIAYLFANRQDLAGKTLSMRGKVVKFNSGIMGRNWIHLQDGSGNPAEGNNDLTVTTDASATVGDTVVVSGVLVLDKDFGAGYSYPVLLEQATVTGE